MSILLKRVRKFFLLVMTSRELEYNDISMDLYDDFGNLTTVVTSLCISNFTNESHYEEIITTEELAISWLRDVTLGTVLTLLSLLTIVGNAMVLHAVRTEKRLQTVSNMFIISLAVADLIVGLIVMPISAIYIFTEDWFFGLVVCQFWIGVDYTASTASILNLLILSLDRYWSVTSPLKYIRKRTKKRAIIMISFVWSASSLWLIPIIGWHIFEHGGERTVPDHICDTEYATNTTLKIITAILNYYLPLAVMFGLYSKIFIEIKRRSKIELGQITIGRNTYNSECKEDDSGDKNGTTGSKHLRKESKKQFLHPSLSNRMSECDTETSDDEISKLFKEDYTNLTLLHVARDRQLSSPELQGSGSDVETRTEYCYDELVLDPKTEKLHRFAHEQVCPVSRLIDKGTIETSLSETKDMKKTQLVPSRKISMNANSNQYKERNSTCSINFDTSVSRSSSVRNKRRTKKSKMSSLSKFKYKSKTLYNMNGQNIENALQKHAKKWTQKFKTTNKTSLALSKEIKAARQLGVIMGAFCICFLPYFVCFMVVAYCEKCIEPGLMVAVTWIGYLNSTLNPLLYPLCNCNFRIKFKKMLNMKPSTPFLRHFPVTRTHTVQTYDAGYDY